MGHLKKYAMAGLIAVLSVAVVKRFAPSVAAKLGI